ncbi:MAG: hypothetical protein ACR2LY_02540 [Thermoleophilaceae bacterium]
MQQEGTQAYCPRCGFIPRAPRTTCPVCAQALAVRGPGVDATRSSAGALVALGLGLAFAMGGLALVLVDGDVESGRMGAGIPQLVPPDSGVLGVTESGRDEKKDPRDGEERRGRPADDEGRGREAEGRGRDGDDDAGEDDGGEDRPPEDVGDLASMPPLLPPIGSEDPDGGSSIPPLAGAPGMPPALTPVADLGGVSSNDDDSDHNDGGGDDDRGGDKADAADGGSGSVEPDRFNESTYTVALASGSQELRVAAAADDPFEIASSTARLLAEASIDAPVGVVDDRGKRVAYAGRFAFTDEGSRDTAMDGAIALLQTITQLPAELFPFDESLLCVRGTDENAFSCPEDGPSTAGDGERAAARGGDASDPLADVLDFGSDEGAGGDESLTDPGDETQDHESAAEQSPGEPAPVDVAVPGGK